jgi:hypothetical protein
MWKDRPPWQIYVIGILVPTVLGALTLFQEPPLREDLVAVIRNVQTPFRIHQDRCLNPTKGGHTVSCVFGVEGDAVVDLPALSAQLVTKGWKFVRPPTDYAELCKGEFLLRLEGVRNNRLVITVANPPLNAPVILTHIKNDQRRCLESERK